jgi:GLPGLI family protein
MDFNSKKINIKMKYLSIITLALFSHFANCQAFEGEVKYKMTQNWIKKMAPLTYMSKIEKEKMEYQFGSSEFSEWEQYNLLYFNQNESKYIESEEKAEDQGGYSWKKQKYEIRKNYANKTQNDILELFGKVYMIEDSLPVQNWKIKNDIKEIAGHICMNAVRTDTTKLQKIEAWFAMDIPVPTGPERNFGLPGLILEVNVNDDAMVITAQSVTMRKLTNELEMPKKLKSKKIKEAEYQAMINKHMKEKIKAEEFPYWGIPY